MNARSDSSRGRAIVPIQPKGTRPPLYVMSGIDGHVLGFQKMAFHLGEDQPVYGLVPRVLDNGEPCHTRVEDMAAYYVEAIRTSAARGPVSPGGAFIRRNRRVRGGTATRRSRQLRQPSGVIRYDRTAVQRAGEEVAWISAATRCVQIGAQVRHPRSRSVWAVSAAISEESPENVLIVPEWAGPPGPTFPRNNQRRELNAFANYEPKPYPAALTLFRSTSRGPSDGEDEFLGWGGSFPE